jgi:pilus assembly protein CpaB
MRTVVIAQKEIPTGEAVQPDQISVVGCVADLAPEGTFSSPSSVVGRIVKTTIYPHEMVLKERLVEPGSPGGLPALIPEGQRAVTLRVDDTISVAGFIQPGHYVDIVTTIDLNKEQKETVSKVILQNIQVIATGQEVERKEEAKPKVVPTVTVLVTLEQAERLILAVNAGTVRLVLRSQSDHQQEETRGARLSSLISDADRGVLPPKPGTSSLAEETRPQNVRTVVVYRGTARSEVSFNH